MTFFIASMLLQIKALTTPIKRSDAIYFDAQIMNYNGVLNFATSRFSIVPQSGFFPVNCSAFENDCMYCEILDPEQFVHLSKKNPLQNQKDLNLPDGPDGMSEKYTRPAW